MQQAFRAAILHCLSDPGPHADAAAMQHIEDGLLVVEDGRVANIGVAEDWLPRHGPGDDPDDEDRRRARA